MSSRLSLPLSVALHREAAWHRRRQKQPVVWPEAVAADRAGPAVLPVLPALGACS